MTIEWVDFMEFSRGVTVVSIVAYGAAADAYIILGRTNEEPSS
jgi:hypothetical protein